MLKDKHGNEVGIGDWIVSTDGYRVIVDDCCGCGLLVKVWDVIFDDSDLGYTYDDQHDGYLTPREVMHYERA